MKLSTARFYPQDHSAYFMRKRGYIHNYSWRGQPSSIFDNCPLNQRTIGKIFQFLHYKSSHAPVAVQKIWKDSYDRFMNRHTARNSSTRFANEFTADRWL